MRASFWRPLSRRGFVGTGSYPAPSRTLSGGLFASPPALLPAATHRDFRCARSAATAVGLGRRTTADQCAFHRFDPRLFTFRQPRWVRLRLLFTRAASPRTLSLAAIPACLVKGGRSASGYPTAPDAALRLHRSLRERCVSPTSATDSTKRAPSGPFDSRLRSFHQACA